MAFHASDSRLDTDRILQLYNDNTDSTLAETVCMPSAAPPLDPPQDKKKSKKEKKSKAEAEEAAPVKRKADEDTVRV